MDAGRSFEEFSRNREYTSAVGVLQRVNDELRASCSLNPQRAAGSARPRGHASRAHALNEHRRAFASARRSCEVATNMDAAFTTREGLLAAGVVKPLLDAVSLSAPFPPNAVEAAAAIRYIAAGSDGRDQVGARKGVKALLDVWKVHPHEKTFAQALVMLCSGHIDNISRFMREGGMQFAMEMWANFAQPASDSTEAGEQSKNHVAKVSGALSSASREVIEETLILVGVCCVCLPDAPEAEAAAGYEPCMDTLIPSLLKVLSSAVADRRHGVRIATHALSALANIGEATARECVMSNRYVPNEIVPVDGFRFEDSASLAAAICGCWQTWPNSKRIVCAASWALCSLHRASYISLDSGNAQTVLLRLKAGCPFVSSTVQLVFELCSGDESTCESPSPSSSSSSLSVDLAHASPGNLMRKRSIADVAPMLEPVSRKKASRGPKVLPSRRLHSAILA